MVPIDDVQHEKPRVHHVIQDTMDPVVNHADGMVYESKSAFRKTMKQHGCIEFGNEMPKPNPTPITKGLRETIEKTHAIMSQLSPDERRNYMERHDD